MKRLFAILLILYPLLTSASERDTSAFVHRVGVDVRCGMPEQKHDLFKGANVSGRPVRTTGSAHVRYSFMFPSSSRMGKMYPTAYQGVGVAANIFFGHRELGSPAAVYVFQGAQIARFGNKISLDYEWNFGVSFGWHTDDVVVGTEVNAYINGGLMLSWYPTDDWTFSFGADVTHFSNGDTTFPNGGVNTLCLRAGAVRSFGGVPPMARGRAAAKYAKGGRFADRISCDVLLFGAWNEESVEYSGGKCVAEGKFAVVGLHVNPLCRLTRFLLIGPALDVQYNEGMNLQNHIAGITPSTGEIKFYRPPFLEQFAAGLSLRAELQMPVFSINLGVGHNVVYRGEELSGLYTLLSLKTFCTESLFLNVGLKVTETGCSNNLQLGLGWRFGNDSK